MKIEPQSRDIPDRIGVIDLIAHDTKTDEALLVMEESLPWDG
jgi:hypothetical protein